MVFRKKIHKKNPSKFFKNLSYPVLILSSISFLLICSTSCDMFFSEMEDETKRGYKPDLSKLLKKNSYEKKYGDRIIIQINNGCGETGFAETYKIFLREEGFDVMEIGNAKIHDFTTIKDHTNKKEMAEYLAEVIGGDNYKDSIRILDNLNKNLRFDLTLVIGKDYKNLDSYNKSIINLPRVLK